MGCLVSAFGSGLVIGLIIWPFLPHIKRCSKRIEKEESRQVKIEIELTDMENKETEDTLKIVYPVYLRMI